VVSGDERGRLAAGFGAVLRVERAAAGLTQVALAERAGLAERTVQRLESGAQRPSTGSTWRVAKALRPGGDLRAQVALDLRLRLAAGRSLRDFSRRVHRKREAIAAELMALGEPPLTDADDFTGFVATLLATGSIGG
jgi:transcriptional regulator with XRE-family HTH domain